MPPFHPADAAHLLLTSPRPLSLTTTYNLTITLPPSGPPSLSLVPSSPTTPTAPTNTRHFTWDNIPPPSSQSPDGDTDMDIFTPISPSPSSNIFSNLASNPIVNRGPGQKYLLIPSFSQPLPSYIHSPQGMLDDGIIQSRYPGEWFESYVDWAGRLEEVLEDEKEGKGGWEEGERETWIVEGGLLAAWLCLQEGVGSVGYRVGGREWVFERGCVGGALGEVMGAVGGREG